MKKAILFLSVAICFAAAAAASAQSFIQGQPNTTNQSSAYPIIIGPGPSPRVDPCESIDTQTKVRCYEYTVSSDTARQIAMLDSTRDRKMEIALYRAALIREVGFNNKKSDCDKQYPDDVVGFLICIRK